MLYVLMHLCDEVNASIAICSDSQAALKALAAAKSTSQLVLETMKALTELSIHNCVRLLWVPGHSGCFAVSLVSRLLYCLLL